MGLAASGTHHAEKTLRIHDHARKARRPEPFRRRVDKSGRGLALDVGEPLVEEQGHLERAPVLALDEDAVGLDEPPAGLGEFQPARAFALGDDEHRAHAERRGGVGDADHRIGIGRQNAGDGMGRAGQPGAGAGVGEVRGDGPGRARGDREGGRQGGEEKAAVDARGVRPADEHLAGVAGLRVDDALRKVVSRLGHGECSSGSPPVAAVAGGCSEATMRAGSMRAGSVRVPGGFGFGSTKTTPFSIRTL